MTQENRTKTYEGLFPSQARDAFRVDAADAAQHGWHLVDERWNGQALIVTYEHRPEPSKVASPVPAPAGADPDAPTAATRTGMGWVKVTLGALATIVAVIAVTGAMYRPSTSSRSNEGPRTIRVSAAQYGSEWPLTVSGGVLSCETYMEVVLTTPDGTSYGINGSARGNDRWVDGRTIYKPGVVGVDTSFLIELGLGVCED
jgi:hypothetical protein